MAGIKSTMSELDLSSVEITNPTSEDFTWRYNGTPYTVKAGEKKAFAKPVAFHLSKHLSSKMITAEAQSKMTKADALNSNAAIHTKIAQLGTYDTPERRIALYKIFGGVEYVTEVITHYPFKGFIGEMSLYQDFVEKQAPKEKVKTE